MSGWAVGGTIQQRGGWGVDEFVNHHKRRVLFRFITRIYLIIMLFSRFP